MLDTAICANSCVLICSSSYK